MYVKRSVASVCACVCVFFLFLSRIERFNGYDQELSKICGSDVAWERLQGIMHRFPSWSLGVVLLKENTRLGEPRVAFEAVLVAQLNMIRFCLDRPVCYLFSCLVSYDECSHIRHMMEIRARWCLFLFCHLVLFMEF